MRHFGLFLGFFIGVSDKIPLNPLFRGALLGIFSSLSWGIFFGMTIGALIGLIHIIFGIIYGVTADLIASNLTRSHRG